MPKENVVGAEACPATVLCVEFPNKEVDAVVEVWICGGCGADD